MAGISGTPAPPGTTLILLRVVDSNQNPIAGATIAATAAAGPFTVQTDAGGEYPAFLSPDAYDFTVTATGHPVLTGPATLADPGILTFTLDNGPFSPAPRVKRSDMCGLNIPGLPPVAGGAADASLFLSWFYHLYDDTTRKVIRIAARNAGWTTWLMSWPDAQNAGFSPAQFAAFNKELIAAGFAPQVMLSAKPTSSDTTRDIEGTLANIMLVLPMLIGTVPDFCIGWELSLWMSPTDLQFLIDHISPLCLAVPGTRVYVHFQPGYFAYQLDGHTTSAFWVANQGKLHGVFHQRDQNEDKGVQSEYQARIVDCLVRFAGGFNFPTSNGIDGLPFDFIALEITAEERFNGQMDQATGDSWGRAAINTPPSGAVSVMGSGNGQ